MTIATKTAERVSLNLTDDESSVAQVVVNNFGDDDLEIYISNSVRIHVAADPEESTVWVNVAGHTFVRVGTLEPVTTHVEIVSHRFTEAEARALVATLTHELAKLPV